MRSSLTGGGILAPHLFKFVLTDCYRIFLFLLELALGLFSMIIEIQVIYIRCFAEGPEYPLSPLNSTSVFGALLKVINDHPQLLNRKYNHCPKPLEYLSLPRQCQYHFLLYFFILKHNLVRYTSQNYNCIVSGTLYDKTSLYS